ncbi:MAG: Rrf2 family transcriptional regulator [Armatimonadia bacterium]
MKISTRTRYGMRAMACLAQHYGQGPCSVREMAQANGLPVKYLEQLCGTLKNAGLLKSVRGAGGGYVLARPPEQIRLVEVFEALEGALAPVRCLENGKPCRRRGNCLTRGIWEHLADVMRGALEEQTLADVLSGAKAELTSVK